MAAGKPKGAANVAAASVQANGLVAATSVLGSWGGEANTDDELESDSKSDSDSDSNDNYAPQANTLVGCAAVAAGAVAADTLCGCHRARRHRHRLRRYCRRHPRIALIANVTPDIPS